ncbi:ABC transporter substrate-binding protein [Silvibacterium sp.]|uniref:ABC transporter substrate-binding protein n=1 Tax=Silvibacterium sp. TaxID=1964179 RepID=UPI0039E3382D
MLRAVLRCVAFSLSIVVLAGCHSSGSNGLISVKFQTDWYPQPEHGGFYEALLKGYYKDEGLDVTILPGGPYVIAEQQVSLGAAQFAMGSSDRILEAVAQGQPLVAVAATMQHDPQGIMMHANSPVHAFPDLEGHTVAIKTGATWFEYIVARYQLKTVREIPATYSIANFLADPNYIQQIFVTSEPFFARKAGADIRTLLISDTGYDPYRVFFTSQSYAQAHPDVVAKFVRASLRGWRDYMADPTEVNAELLKRNPAMTAEQMNFTWQALRDGHFIYPANDPAAAGSFDPARWAAMEQQLANLKVLAHPVEPTSAYTLKFLSAR